MEVKSYKCDICGKVYYSDTRKEWEKFTVKCVSGDGKQVGVKKYEHLCPDCGENIKTIVNEPKALEELQEELNNTRSYKIDLQYMIRDLFSYVCWFIPWISASEEKYEYEGLINMIKDELDDRKKQVNELSDIRTYLVERSHKQMITIKVLSCVTIVLAGALCGAIAALV